MMTIDEMINSLESTPKIVRQLFEQVPSRFLTVNEGPETFSAADVLGHLIQGEKTDWIPRLRRILEHGETKPFTPFDRFAHLRADDGSGISKRIDEFAEWRLNNVAVLKAYAAKGLDFSLKGVHPDLGVVTLGQILHTWVLHDWS
ncbi:MAG: DinB family protein, partial [Bacteroidetes bacterium]|nr:DinB family protein [Bacteroidota bacterium]